jgi:hypothetical protein
MVTRTGTSLGQTLAAGKTLLEERFAAGFEQLALDQAARDGLAHGAFEESADEGAAVVEEFYPDRQAGSANDEAEQPSSLTSRLQEKARKVAAGLAATE